MWLSKLRHNLNAIKTSSSLVTPFQGLFLLHPQCSGVFFSMLFLAPNTVVTLMASGHHFVRCAIITRCSTGQSCLDYSKWPISDSCSEQQHLIPWAPSHWHYIHLLLRVIHKIVWGIFQVHHLCCVLCIHCWANRLCPLGIYSSIINMNK